MSEAPKVLGETAAVKQGLRYSVDPWNGNSVVHTYKGSRDAIDVLEGSVKASGYRYDVDKTGPVCVLTYYDETPDGTYNDPGETWELRSYDVTKSLSTHKYFDGEEAWMAEIDQVFNGNIPATIAQATKDKTLLQDYITKRTEKLNAKTLFYIACRSRGIDSYIIPGFHIVKTTSTTSPPKVAVSDNQAPGVRADVYDVMEVSTPQVPGYASFSLPSGQWLKKAPQVYDMGHGRFRVTEEWVWADKWLANIYDGGTWEPTIAGA